MNVKTRPFELAEFARILDICGLEWRSIYSLAFLTAFRISDLLLLPNCDVSDIPPMNEQKTGSPIRLIKSPSFITHWNVLRRFASGQYLLRRRDPSTYRKSLQNHCIIADVPLNRVAFHSIRKTAANSVYRSQGFMAANQLLNHRKLNTTLFYLNEESVEVDHILDVVSQMNIKSWDM